MYVKVCGEHSPWAPLNITRAIDMDASWYEAQSMYF